MDDLGFVIDGLYASGWWPGPDEVCLQSSDGRWVPSEATILTAFAQLASPLTVHKDSETCATQASWSMLGRGTETVRGRSRQEALILAYSRLLALQSHHTQNCRQA